MGTEKPDHDALAGLQQAICRAWSPVRWTSVTSLVAVSGGADSVALLRALAGIHAQHGGEGQLIVAHFHHGLRGDAADGDAQFVQQLAEQLGLAAVVGRADSPCGDSSPGDDRRGIVDDEASLRRDRYRFLGQQAHRLGARYVALGHTQDDNVETLLHQLMRGTGPAGLVGMPRHRELVADVMLVRPLLDIPRGQLTAALEQLQQAWRLDASNQELRWKRNWIRHELLPLIESQYRGAGERIAATIRQQADVMGVIDQQAEAWSRRCIVVSGASVVVRFHAAADAVVIQALRKLWDQQGWARGAMGESHWRALLESIRQSVPQRFDLPGGVSVETTEDHTRLRHLRRPK